RIMNEVFRGRRGGKRSGNYEVGGHEAEQNHDEKLAPPARNQALQERDRTAAVRRPLRNVEIDWQRPEQCREDDTDGRKRCKPARRLIRQRWLIAQRAQIIERDETQHSGPGGLVWPATEASEIGGNA